LVRADSPSSPDARRTIDQSLEDVLNLSRDVQALSHRLHPARLEYLGIAAAAAALCHEISGQQSLDVRFHTADVPEGLSRRIALCLYRVLQEAVQNAVKHSGAKRIDVSLIGRGDQLELTVRDLGVGFDLEASQSAGLGLISMKERLKAVNGQLAIRSRPRHGTRIHARVPFVRE
jgi:signal transduction histidine kinase